MVIGGTLTYRDTSHLTTEYAASLAGPLGTALRDGPDHADRPARHARRTMKLSMPLVYGGNPRETADQVAGLEKAGLDMIWVAEPYGFDSPTLMGYLAAKTETVEIGAGILNVYSRTPGALLQTAAGLDNVSGGRAMIGLGASGPQVDRGLPRRGLRPPAGPHPRGRGDHPDGPARASRWSATASSRSRCPPTRASGSASR